MVKEESCPANGVTRSSGSVLCVETAQAVGIVIAKKLFVASTVIVHLPNASAAKNGINILT